MGEIVIKLNPQKLLNPDLDIRYSIPETIEELSGGRMESIGYDYIEDEVNSIVIFLSSSSPKEDCKNVISILSEKQFCENWILESAVIAIKDDKEYVVIHPVNYFGNHEFE